MSDELREYVKRISRRVKLHAAIFFGSRARGDHGPWSDYDLLLIGDFNEPYLDRLKTLLDDLPLKDEDHVFGEPHGLMNVMRDDHYRVIS